MRLQKLYFSIKQYVKENDLENSFSSLEELIALSKKVNLKKQFLLLKSNYIEIKQAEMANLEIKENLYKEFSKIKFNILTLADLVMDSDQLFESSKSNTLSIKLVKESPSLILNYLIRSKNEEYEIRGSPYQTLRVLARNILYAFHQDYENSLFFKSGRAEVQVVKIQKDKSAVKLNMGQNLIQNGLKTQDTIAIEYNISNIHRSVTIFENKEF